MVVEKRYFKEEMTMKKKMVHPTKKATVGEIIIEGLKRIDWTAVICFVLSLIAGGMDPDQAVYMGAKKFKVSPDLIRKHMKNKL